MYRIQGEVAAARSTSERSQFDFRRKENTVLRGALDPSIVNVIPNAVVASHFKPVEPQPPLPEIRQSLLLCEFDSL